MADAHSMSKPRKIYLKNVNNHLLCSLCGGYYIDAVAFTECLHAFCRACIVRYLESSKQCPVCCLPIKKTMSLRPDTILQSLVYKVVPNLYSREIQRRADFYHSNGVRASSSCSDDSLLGEKADEWVSPYIEEKSQYFSPEDTISLSLEYYQQHLDGFQDLKIEDSSSGGPFPSSGFSPSGSSAQGPNLSASLSVCSSSTNPKLQNVHHVVTVVEHPTTSSVSASSLQRTSSSASCMDTTVASSAGVTSGSAMKTRSATAEGSGKCPEEIVSDSSGGFADVKVKLEDDVSSCVENKDKYRRYLQCPAAVGMYHLKKFVRMKYGLTDEHRVDIIYQGEVLPPYYSLLDVAYTFNWKREKPMRFFYRIFTPSKIPPIRIIQNQTPNGKQLKIAQVAPTESTEISPSKLVIKNDVDTTTYKNAPTNTSTKFSSPQNSNSAPQCSKKSQSTITAAVSTVEYKKSSSLKKLALKKYPDEDDVDEEEGSNCIYDYQEPDKEEIKKFAEKRDREWAMQKRLDAESHVSRKRKKNKKDKSDNKKRKLHAEIAPTTEVISKSEDSLKLKVKITPHNGHKHKHHRSSPPESPKVQELSPKERLLQMRQVRHKNIQNDEKAPQRLDSKVPEKVEAAPQRQAAPKAPPENSIISGKTLRSDFSIKTTMSKELPSKYAVVNLERNSESTDKAHKLTFLKKSPVNADKTAEKTPERGVEMDKEKGQGQGQTKAGGEMAVTKQNQGNQTVNNVPKPNMPNLIRNNTANKSLEKKIANLHQQCSVDGNKNNATNNNMHKNQVAKMAQNEKKVSFSQEKPQILNNQIITKAFTVSKVETGVKRKLEEDNKVPDKRPSLEITLINPQAPGKASGNNVQAHKPMSSPTETPAMSPKRSPPQTIPLVRIKKSVNLKGGISIIPKMPERCDKIGALDLSKPGKSSPETPEYKVPQQVHASPKLQERLQQSQKQDQVRPGTPALRPSDKTPTSIYSGEKNSLSNLQMLSKVATEHPDLLMNKNLQQNFAKKPQMPSLQTLKIPVPQSQQGLQTKMPKLGDISKGGQPQMARQNNLQNRTMRHAQHQNQSIRNIPNPSLLVRQQNQNRINAMKGDASSSLAKVVNSLQQAKNNNQTNGNVLIKGVESYAKEALKDDCKDLIEKKSFEHKTVEAVAN